MRNVIDTHHFVLIMHTRGAVKKCAKMNNSRSDGGAFNLYIMHIDEKMTHFERVTKYWVKKSKKYYEFVNKVEF
jgi:hypothetical protein